MTAILSNLLQKSACVWRSLILKMYETCIKDKNAMKVDIFDFELDKDLIAKQPANPRDSSRLLDLSEENQISNEIIISIPLRWSKCARRDSIGVIQ